MRRFNAVLAVIIIALFLYHMIYGILELCGMAAGGDSKNAAVSGILLVLISLHILIGIKLTADTLISKKNAGAFYPKYNRLFLARRLSGFSLMLFMMIHVFIFSGRRVFGQYRLNNFDAFSLITQILMIVSLLIHLCTNITPLRIALGLSDEKNLRTDIIWVISILLLFSAAAFFIYYLRWGAV